MRIPFTDRPLRLIAGVLGALVVGLSLSVPVTAQISLATANQPAPAWPHEKADLKPEPGVLFGTLPNGMRYAIQRNTTPPGQVAMRLLIQAGSMHEGPGQEGVAHLLEHMAYQGTTNVPRARLGEALSSMSMNFGSDANAATTQFMTFFLFNLPRGDAKSLDTSLNLLREFASEMTLDPARLDNERGVVLSEERFRGGGGVAFQEALLRAQLGDHPYVRPAIGDPQVIRTVSVQRVREFYEAYYRPERATLIVVGDVDPKAVEAMMRTHFADWRGKGPAGGDPQPVSGRMTDPPVQMKIIPGAPQNALQIIWRHPYRPHDPSRAARLKRELELIGQQAMAIRIREQSEAAGQPFLEASPVTSSDVPGVARVSSMDASFINDVPKAVNVLLTVQRQVAQQGITQVEIDRAIAARRLGLQNRVAETASRETMALMGGLMNYAFSGELITDPKTSLALFEEAVKTATPASVNAALRQHFEGEPTVVYYGAAEPPGGQAALAAAVASARQAPLTAYAATALKPWKHTDFGAPGRVVERRTREDVGVTLVKFANGVRLTVKPTEFSDETVMVKVRFGYGQLHLPSDALTAADFASTILSGGGLVDMTRQEQMVSLAGKQVVALASQADDAFEYTNPLGVPAANLDLQMQLFAASVSRNGFRTDDWAVTIRSGAEAERAAPFDAERLYNRFAPAALHSNDMRWVISTPDQHATWDPKDAVAYIRPIVETYPLEVVMVGDVTVERAIEVTAKTLGALPPRREIAEPADLRRVQFPAGSLTPIEVKHKGRPDQALVAVHWPASDALSNPKDTQAAAILSKLIGGRLYAIMREQQGRTYSPKAFDQLSTVLPGYGTIGVEMTVQPQDVRGALRVVDAVAYDLVTRGVSQEELAAGISAQVESIARQQRDNRYWLEALNRAHDEPRMLDLAANAIAVTRSLTPADIRSVAERWLRPERAWRMTVTPETPVTVQR